MHALRAQDAAGAMADAASVASGCDLQPSVWGGGWGGQRGGELGHPNAAVSGPAVLAPPCQTRPGLTCRAIPQL